MDLKRIMYRCEMSSGEKVLVNFRIPKTLKMRLDKYCQKNKTPITEVVKSLIYEFLSQIEKEKN